MFAQGFYENSDAHYKQNISTLDNALDTILNLRGVTVDWNREAFKEKQHEEDRAELKALMQQKTGQK